MCAEHPLSVRSSTTCEGEIFDALVKNVIAHGSVDNSWVGESEVLSGEAGSTALAVVGAEEEEVPFCALRSSSECMRDLCKEHQCVPCPSNGALVVGYLLTK